MCKDNELAGAPEIPPEMIEAGEEIILAEVGVPGDEICGSFSAPDLAKKVFEAMSRAECSSRK